MKTEQFLEAFYRAESGKLGIIAPVTVAWCNNYGNTQYKHFLDHICYRITFTGFFDHPYEHLFHFFANPTNPPTWWAEQDMFRPLISRNELYQFALERIDDQYRHPQAMIWNVQIEEVYNCNDILTEIFGVLK